MSDEDVCAECFEVRRLHSHHGPCDGYFGYDMTMSFREVKVRDLVASGVVHWAESWLYSDDEISRLWVEEHAY